MIDREDRSGLLAAAGWPQVQTGEPFSVSTGDDFAGVGPAAGPQLSTIGEAPQWAKKFASNRLLVEPRRLYRACV